MDPEATLRPTSFENVQPLNDHLRLAFKKFWATGTHLAVDETQEWCWYRVESAGFGGARFGRARLTHRAPETSKHSRSLGGARDNLAGFGGFYGCGGGGGF